MPRSDEFEHHERMYTTGLPGPLARFRMEVVVTPIMTQQYSRKVNLFTQCVIVYITTLIPTAYPFGENR
jgi:hypothetical protein